MNAPVANPCALSSVATVGLRCVEPIAGVVADAVLVRIPSAEDAGVRRQRDDRVGVREVEARAARGQRVQVRRRGAPAVRTERVGAQRVDRDEQHVAIGVDVESRTAGVRSHHHAPTAAITSSDADDRDAPRDLRPPVVLWRSLGTLMRGTFLRHDL